MITVLIVMGSFIFGISGPDPYRRRYGNMILAFVFIVVMWYFFKLFML
jgi:hypothetical protein